MLKVDTQTQNVILFGDRVFVGVIKVNEIIRVETEFNITDILIRRKIKGTYAHRGPVKATVRRGSSASQREREAAGETNPVTN